MTDTSSESPGRESRPESPIQSYLHALRARFVADTGGQVARYIPELANADPALFGIAIATVDGQVYESGDARAPFTIQSISKPLVYGVALEDRGAERVRRAIGVEPTGDAFNSISLEPGTGRPLNPMVNAGAIAVSSLVAGVSPAERLARVQGAISAYAGRPLAIDEAVFASERDTGHRNRAIGHLLRNADVLDDPVDDALELYFKQCSIAVDCRDLALIAATLANGGVNPATRQRAVASEHVGAILSVMTTCGMYDFAGEWVVRVGMPAKSGVGGGIIAVLPGQLGIGVFSPALDARGNSVRGVKVCEAISAELGLHFLQPPRGATFTVRARYTAQQVRSKRRRSAAEVALLERHGAEAIVHELQGDLRFSTLEPVIRHLMDAGAAMTHAVLDFKRVAQADAAATRMLARLIETCARRGQHIVLSRVRRADLLTALGSEVDPHALRAMSFQPQLDLALEWCERQLIERHAGRHLAQHLRGLREHQLCAGLSDAQVDVLESCLQRQSFDPGTPIVEPGDAADALYLLLRGEVSVAVAVPGGALKRLATLTAGMSFGEAALIDGGRRSAEVRADSQVECAVVGREVFARLEREHPAIAIRLLHNLLRSATETSVRLTGEVAALEA
jgi:glutaminase